MNPAPPVSRIRMTGACRGGITGSGRSAYKLPTLHGRPCGGGRPCQHGGMPGELVLVVDDEPTVREVVSRYLELGGYRVTVAADGHAALQLALSTQAPPDLVVLDLMLPGIDGLEVCRRLRAAASVPIVMLTARGHEADRIVGLELGADDYVVKPFSPRELVARVRSVLRRTRGDPAAPQGRVHAGDVMVDPATREVEVAGRPVALTAREFELLLFLVR